MTDNFIQFNERAYKFIRGSAVNTIIDALVELITNADDAYDKGKIQKKKINIHLNYDGILEVTDQAIGLNAEEMKKCFLQVGNYTSQENNRGFFSRGAKDISALGNVYFESIKNDNYSKLLLDKNAKGELLVSDNKVTEDLRKHLKILKNGTKVQIQLNEGVDLYDPKQILEIFSRHISLRNILNNKNCDCKITFENSKMYEFNYKEFTFKYSFPHGEILLYLTYSMPSYPEAEAFFSLSKTNKQLFNDQNMKYCDWGILITSNKVIHDISTINPQFKFNPHMKTLFGIIHCDYINKLLVDYDNNGSSKLNPFPILDPSRVGGLNYDHPFLKELIKIPNDRLDLILQELEVDEDNEYVFLNNELMDIINQLNITGDKFMDSNDLTQFVENKNSNLIRGIESDRGKYVTVEKNFLHDLNKTTRLNYNPKIDKKEARPYEDPMSKLFDIIGVGDEGNAPTEEKSNAKLYKEFDSSVMNNVETEEKKIFHYNKVEGQENEQTEDFESQNYQHLKKDNMFIIKFIKSTQDRKYEIYQSGQKIILKINVDFPILKKYFNSESNFSADFETSKLEAIMYLHEIMTEALTRVQLISYINRDFIKINDTSSSVNFQELFKNYDSYKNNIDISIDKVIQNVINVERSKIKKLITYDNWAVNDSSIEEPINDYDDFTEALNNMQKIETPDKIEHNTGFEEKLVIDDNSKSDNLGDFLLKDKLDKLTKENEKLLSENVKLKSENDEIKIDLKELKELLMEDIENKVIKRFRRVEKFIDYNFKHSEDGLDFINFFKITKYHISPALNFSFDKYNLEKYDYEDNNNNTNHPTIFYGVYRPFDVQIIKNHIGPKYVFWDDNDANINYVNRRDTLIEISKLADLNICNTMVVEKYLQIMNIKYKKIKF